MWQSTLAASLLLLAPVSANIFLEGSSSIAQREDMNAEVMRRYTDSISSPLERRQAQATPTSNLTNWDNETSQSCTTALQAFGGQANNPSGMAVCYNLPSFDMATGVFQADLRLFAISPPSGSFANVPSGAVMVGLSYSGATVSVVDPATLRRRDEDFSLSWPRDFSLVMKRQTAAAPMLLQTYNFVGQVNRDLLGPNLNNERIQRVLVPVVTLSAVDATGNPINTTLSSNGATFVNGVFAAAAVPTTVAQRPLQTLVVASDAPFIVPGLSIAIFPIGGIITGTWATLFIATVSYGTYGRMQFRDQFRRRTQMQRKRGMTTI